MKKQRGGKMEEKNLIEKYVWFYHNQRYSVIPIKLKSKEPNIISWKKFQEVRPTDDEIKEWQRLNLFENIGIICGKVSNNLVVIDIDDNELIKKLNIKLENFIKNGNWVVKTAKGWHIYCRNETNPDNIIKNNDLKIEKRGNGGYVVAPPSIHPSGEKYEFLNVNNPEDLKPLPIENVDLIWDYLINHSKIFDSSKPACILNILQTKLDVGKRNDTAFALVHYYNNIKQLNPEEIKTILKKWNIDNKEPLENKELETVINSASKSDKKTGCNKLRQLGFCPYNDKNDCSFFNPLLNKKDDKKTENIKSLLSKEKRPYQSIGRGIHNDILYIGTYVEDNGYTYDAIITSDKKIYINYLRKEKNVLVGKNQIKDDFGLNYRDGFFADVLDTCISNNCINKFLFENYKVDIREIFKRIVSVNKKYMIYEDGRIHTFVALDIIRSHFFPLFSANGRTFFHAEPGSGKTNQLMIYRGLCFNPISSADFSGATIYRNIESTSGTILIDDFDLLPEPQKNQIMQHIRANYKPFKVVRSDKARNYRPRGYNAYSHLAFNNVYGLGYDTITPERLITIRLLKHNEARDLNIDYTNPIFSPIRDDLYVCLLQYWKIIKETYNTLKVKQLSARELELFKPLLTIAKVIGDDVYDGILQFAIEYLQQERMKDLTSDWEYNLLKNLWEKVEDLKDEYQTIDVSVKDISDELAVELLIIGDQNYKNKKHSLSIFIGNKLTSYVLFKKKRPGNVVHYMIYKKGILKILESKNMLCMLGVLDELTSNNKDGVNKKSLDDFNNNSNYNNIHNTINTSNKPNQSNTLNKEE
jgi:hypothetical protein